jgi:uncharacterized Zn finger protein
MTTDELRPKALAVLREGRLSIYRVTVDGLARMNGCIARVDGHNGTYVVDFNSPRRGWHCTCPNSPGCAHIAATQLVTPQETT